ncbi:MAG: M56 family metallopeptidase [Pirellulales bacterium]
MSPLAVSLWLLQLAADFTEVGVVWLVQSTVILLLALAAGRILASRGPALHSAIYRTALVAVVACPVATLMLSAWGQVFGLRLPAIEVIEVANNEAVSETGTEPAGTPIMDTSPDSTNHTSRLDNSAAAPSGRARDPNRLPFDAAVDTAQFAPANWSDAQADVPLVTPTDDRRAPMVVSAASDIDRAEPAVRVRTGVSVLVVAVAFTWLCTSLVLISRLLAGLRSSARLVRQTVAAEQDEQRVCRELAAAVGVRAPRLARSAFVDSPCLVGVVRPAILLPEGPLGMPLDAVLIHELAHLRRGDHVWNIAARSALCVGFAQPLLWMLVRRMETAAEEVCDDHAVHFGADRTRYADGLVTLAERSALPLPNISVPLITLRSLLARRVRRILDYQGSRLLRIGKPALCALLVFGVLAAVLSGFVSTPENAGAAAADREPAQPAGAPTTAATSAERADPLPAGAIARLGTTRYRPASGAEGIGFLPDGKTLVLTTTDGKLEHWDAESGRFLRELRVSKEMIREADHTADGRLIAIRGSRTDEQKRGTFRWVAVVDAQTGEERMRRDVDGDRHDEHLAISDNGASVATDDALGIIDVAANAEVIRWPLNDRVWSMAFSPDGETLAVGIEGMVQLWNWTAGAEPRRLTRTEIDPRRKPNFWSLAFSADGSRLAAGDDDGISLFDVAQGTEQARFTIDGAPGWRGYYLLLSPDGRLLAAAVSFDRGGTEVVIWETDSGKLQRRFAVPHDSMRHLAFSPDGRLLAGTSWTDPVLCVWNVATGERLGSDLIGHEHAPNTLRFLRGDEGLVSAGDDATVRIWNIATSQQETLLEPKLDPNDFGRWIRAMDVSRDGKYVAASSLDDSMTVWELETGRELYRLPGHGGQGGNRALRFTTDSRRFVSWGDDMRVRVWDVKTGKALQEYRPQPSGVKLPPENQANDPFGRGGRDVFRFDDGVLSPDASLLFIQAAENRVFDVATGKELAKFAGPQGFNRDPAISRDNQYVLSTTTTRGRQIPSADGRNQLILEWHHTLELRKLADGQLVTAKTLPNGWVRSAVAFSPDGRQAAIAVDDDKPYVLIVDIPDLREVGRLTDLGGRPSEIEFSGSGKRLAISNYDGTISVFDLEKHAQEKQEAPAPPNSKSSAEPAKSGDGQRPSRTSSAAIRATKTATDDTAPLPAGAVARLGTTRFRPTVAALGVSFLPDSRTLAQTTRDGHIEYWDAESGLLLRSVRLPAERVAAAHHSPNGRFVVLRGFAMSKEQQIHSPSVRLIDPADGKELMSVDLPELRGEKIAVSADGATIAIDDAAKLSIIDAAAKAEVRLHRLDHQAHSLALSPDAKTVAVGSRGKLLVWKWSSGDEPKSVPIGDSPRRPVTVTAMAFSPDGAYLAAGGHDFSGIALLDAKTGDQKRRFDIEGVKSWYPHSLAFSADGSMLATPLDRNAGGGVAVWNVASGKLLHRLDVPHEEVSDVVFSPDGRLLAGTNSWEKQMCVWNLASGERLGRDLPGHAASPSALRFLPGDGRLVSAGPDGTIQVWKVAESTQERVISHERDATGYRMRAIRALDASPNGKLIASSSMDDTVRVWETDSGIERFRLPGHGRVGGNRAVRFTPDGRRLVSWGDDMRLYVWDVGTGKAVNEHRVKLSDDNAEGIPFAAGYGGLEVLRGALSPDASRLLLLRNDLHLFDVVSGKEIGRQTRAVRDISRLAISPDNGYEIVFSSRQGRELPAQRRRTAATHLWDHLVQLRKLTDGELLAEKTLPEPGDAVATFSPDGRLAAIASGHENPHVLIVSVPEFEELGRIEGLSGGASAVEFSRSGKRLAVANADTTIVLYDLETVQVPSNQDN